MSEPIVLNLQPMLSIFLVICIMIFSYLGARDSMKQEAVKRGHAEYYLNKNNKRKWRWLPTCKESEADRDK